MARIAGINIPNHQHAEIGLTAIFGIGRPRARDICDAAGVPYAKKVKDLTDDELEYLAAYHLCCISEKIRLLEVATEEARRAARLEEPVE